MSLDRARRLSKASARLYDGHPDLAAHARRSAGSAFGGGAEWMRAGLGRLRRRAPGPMPAVAWQRWGVFKYGVCALAGLGAIGAAVALGAPWVAPLACVVAFYAVEAQMVFLFPVLLDDVPHPLQTARRLTRDAGGTVAVMITVLPLAATMLFGGLAGRGFVRSWCIGCGAVLVWYDELVGAA